MDSAGLHEEDESKENDTAMDSAGSDPPRKESGDEDTEAIITHPTR